MGTFDEEHHIPARSPENDLGDVSSMEDAYTGTMVDVDDGQMVEGRW